MTGLPGRVQEVPGNRAHMQIDPGSDPDDTRRAKPYGQAIFTVQNTLYFRYPNYIRTWIQSPRLSLLPEFTSTEGAAVTGRVRELCRLRFG